MFAPTFAESIGRTVSSTETPMAQSLRFCAVVILLIQCAGFAGQTRQIKSEQSVGIENHHVSARFDWKTGRLVCLKNLDTSDDYLKEASQGGNPFRAYVDTTITPKVLT